MPMGLTYCFHALATNAPKMMAHAINFSATIQPFWLPVQMKAQAEVTRSTKITPKMILTSRSVPSISRLAGAASSPAGAVAGSRSGFGAGSCGDMTLVNLLCLKRRVCAVVAVGSQAGAARGLKRGPSAERIA